MKNIRFVHTPVLAALTLFALPFSAMASGHGVAKGVHWAESLKMLQSGNERFVEGAAEIPRTDENRRRGLASSQSPHAIVLSCSDSRVPPELVFHQGLGDIFTVRVAGNVLGAATVASIEYAVEHLGSKLIVVMGHESCGAVKAALNTPAGKTAGSPDLDQLISVLQPSFETASGRSLASTLAKDDKKLRKPVMMNVDAVAERLVSRSKIVRKAVESGDVRVVRAIYSLETGKVDFWKTEEILTSASPVERAPASSPPASPKAAEHGESHGKAHH